MKAQIMTTADGDTIDIGKGFKMEAEQPIFINKNGFISGNKITTETLDTLRNLLFTDTGLYMEDYFNMAYAFDNDENYWAEAYRCCLSATTYAEYMTQVINLGGFGDEVIENLVTMATLSAKYVALHIENDSAAICAQIDSVAESFRRMDYIGNIYKDAGLEIMDETLTKPFKKELVRNIENSKKQFRMTPRQTRIIRRFIDVCEKNRTKATRQKAVKQLVSRNLLTLHDYTERDFYLPEDAWEGWDANDKERTLIMKYDDFTFLVILTPTAMNIDEEEAVPDKEPEAMKMFFVDVSMPTDVMDWRVNDIRTVEEQSKREERNKEFDKELMFKRLMLKRK